MKTYERHELSAEYPDITGQPWTDYVANVAEFGIVEGRKIVLYEGKVIDGWQLYRACLEAKVEPQFKELRLPKGMTVERWVETTNDYRRHETQAIMEERAVKRRERVATARAEGKSTRAIAEEEGVSQKTIRNDIQVISGEYPTHLNDNSQKHSEKPSDIHGEDNAKVTGTDGKTYAASKPAAPKCSRCERNARTGQDAVKNCEMCRELRGTKPKPPKAEKSDDKPGEKDAFGNELPKRCRDAYFDPWLQKAIDFLGVTSANFWGERIADGIAKRKKHYPFFDAKEIVDAYGQVGNDLEKLLDHFKDNRPAGVCPSCAGKGCADCRLSGLVPRELYATLKKKAKAS